MAIISSAQAAQEAPPETNTAEGGAKKEAAAPTCRMRPGSITAS